MLFRSRLLKVDILGTSEALIYPDIFGYLTEGSPNIHQDYAVSKRSSPSE